MSRVVRVVVPGIPLHVLLDEAFAEAGAIGDWSHGLRAAEDTEMLKRIRTRTHTGRPCGRDGFIARLEALLQRPLSPQKPGRMRKSAGGNEEGRRNA
jgi:hypothetical protein